MSSCMSPGPTRCGMGRPGAVWTVLYAFRTGLELSVIWHCVRTAYVHITVYGLSMNAYTCTFQDIVIIDEPVG